MLEVRGRIWQRYSPATSHGRLDKRFGPLIKLFNDVEDTIAADGPRPADGGLMVCYNMHSNETPGHKPMIKDN